MIAPVFNGNNEYKIGEYVRYTTGENPVINKLYRFKVNHAANSSWDIN